jgi:hypothetical protein
MPKRYCEYDCGDKLSDGNGNVPLTLFYPAMNSDSLDYLELTGADAAALVGAFIRHEPLRREGTKYQDIVFVVRLDSEEHVLDLVEADGNTWALALTNNDLALLGAHAHVGEHLSARELLSWRERYHVGSIEAR